jgi:ring-1,2-phenylacetyl-CoA epoxidase subunit PaaD
MVMTHDIFDVLQSIPDPEMPISILDLGLIEEVEILHTSVRITVLPTFVGCIALPMIAEEIKTKVGELENVETVEVDFIHDPPWSTDRITEKGKSDLASYGITVPDGASSVCTTHAIGVELKTSAISCPWCDSRDTTLTSPFGPTRCRSIHFCSACRQPFERMKKV